MMRYAATRQLYLRSVTSGILLPRSIQCGSMSVDVSSASITTGWEHLSQDAVAAIIGFWGGVAGQITGVLLSVSSDFLGGRKRAMLIGLSGISVALIGTSTDSLKNSVATARGMCTLDIY